MSVESQLLGKQCEKFLEQYYSASLSHRVITGRNHLVIDFVNIIEFDKDLAEHLLDTPKEVLEALKLASLSITGKPINIRVNKLPPSMNQKWTLRQTEIDKMVMLTGTISSLSPIKFKTYMAKFECPACGQINSMLQIDSQKYLIEPTRCGCGRKGKFKLVAEERYDMCSMELEETPEDSQGSQLQRMHILLREDLCNPNIYNSLKLGGRVTISGVFEAYHPIKKDSKDLELEKYIDANYITFHDKLEVGLMEGDEEQIIKFSLEHKDDIFQYLCSQIFSNIWGYQQEKKILLLSIIGGVKVGTQKGKLHCLMCGDPGTAKTQLLKCLYPILPKGRYVSGKSTSGVGLTASVEKDDLLGGWTLKAGVLPLCHKGSSLIDEFNLINEEDRSNLLNVMESGEVVINKASVHGTLSAEVGICAAANPVAGKFDSFTDFVSQFKIPEPLLNRFDSVLIFQDTPNPEEDKKKSDILLNGTKNNSTNESMDTLFIKKYLSYCMTQAPELTKEAEQILQDWYVQLRGMPRKSQGLPINLRILRAALNYTKALAKIRLYEMATAKEAEEAIELMYYWMKQTVIDEKTGSVAIDYIQTGRQPNKNELIRELKQKFLDKGELWEDIILEEYIGKGAIVMEVLQILKRDAFIFEPRKGLLKVLK